MGEILARVGLYGLAVTMLGGIGLSWHLQTAEADVTTLLSSADVQLRMAYAIPERDKAGIPLSAREDMLVAAEQHLATVERLQPGMACTAEFAGFARMLRGDPLGAANYYAAARRCRDCSLEQGDVLLFNEARMLAQGGRGEQALQVFADHAERLDARFGQQRLVEEISILLDLGQQSTAVERLQALTKRSDLEPLACLQAGQLWERVGDLDAAEQCYTAQQELVPTAQYQLARLKLQRGAVDTALALLEKAVAASPAEARRLVQEDQDVWQALRNDARFAAVVTSPAAAPGR